MPATLDTRLFSLAALMLTLVHPASGQRPGGEPAPMVSLAGPRFGITLLSGGITNKLKQDSQLRLSPVITQFGWQSEKQFRSGLSDVTGLTEVVCSWEAWSRTWCSPA